MNLNHAWLRISCALGFALLALGCATVDPEPSHAAGASVRKVDYRKAPELKELAEHAREFGNAMYPKICALFPDAGTKSPRQFDLVFQPLQSHSIGETHVQRRSIRMNSRQLTNAPDGREMFDKVFVHEMAHLVLLGGTSRWSHPDFGWEEGLADYAYFKLVGTNGWGCPQCDYRYPHYTAGYTCAGAFLLYVESLFGPSVIQQLNSALRHGRYADTFFVQVTGRRLDELWTDFQKTAAFKPGAAEALALMRELGFQGPELPRNALARFNKYLDRHAEEFVKQAVRSANLDGKTTKDVRSLMAVYLYLTQPGGPAEKAWMTLRENGGVPGIAKGEKGSLAAYLKYSEIASQNYPLTRTLKAHKRGDDSVYHYAMTRAAPESDWRLTKAWRTTADGKLAEEFPMP